MLYVLVTHVIIFYVTLVNSAHFDNDDNTSDYMSFGSGQAAEPTTSATTALAAATRATTVTPASINHHTTTHDFYVGAAIMNDTTINAANQKLPRFLVLVPPPQKRDTVEEGHR